MPIEGIAEKLNRHKLSHSVLIHDQTSARGHQHPSLKHKEPWKRNECEGEANEREDRIKEDERDKEEEQEEEEDLFTLRLHADRA